MTLREKIQKFKERKPANTKIFQGNTYSYLVMTPPNSDFRYGRMLATI
jgi:hypothetical protein